jgi:hypothetical protein
MTEIQTQALEHEPRSTDPRSNRLNSVNVARMVEMPQPEFEGFLNTLGRHLGAKATIYTIGSTHMTFLESTGIGPQFRMDGYSPAEVRQFKDSLQRDLDESLFSDAAAVRVNPKQPLVWMGCFGKIALNIRPSEQVQRQRAEIESYLKWRFDRVPTLRSFRPHITIGAVQRNYLTAEEQTNLRLLLPEGLQVPRRIALNGLMASLSRYLPKRPSYRKYRSKPV